MDRLLRPLDNLLNKVTMYRLMLYYLVVLFSLAIIFSLKFLPYNPVDLLESGFYVVFLSFVINWLIAKSFKLRPNFESQFITGLILALIVGPLPLFKNLLFLTVVAALAMVSKYIITYKKQHIFNPAAFAVTITAAAMGQGASWWIGSPLMLPFIAVMGLVMSRKLRRFHLVLSFVISYAVSLSVFSFNSVGASGILNLLQSAFLSPPLLFFTFVMLTEPITSPADRRMRIYFGLFTGFIYAIFSTYFTVSYTLELALISSNLVFRIVSFSEKYDLILQQKKEIAHTIWEFIFEPTRKFSFIPGQYLEWTVPHSHTDSRGNRRYFTIASSPTEKNLRLTVKIPVDKPSSYKNALKNLKTGDSIFATNLEGEFVLNKDTDQKYVFIAGGIGVTPFISFVKNALDKNQKIPGVLFYIAHDVSEFVYKDLFATAEKKIGLKVIYVLGENPPKGWNGEVGRLSEEMIKKHLSDFESPIYYISGPQPMVMAYEDLLQKIGNGNIKYKADFFPGYEETYSR